MKLYDSIFTRKSTRKYRDQPLAQEQLAEIMDFARSAKPLFPEIEIRMELASSADVKGIVSAKAPHYLLFYSEKKEGYLPNAGFLLQQVDLYLASKELGSCWLGIAKTTAPSKNGLDYVIMLAFGLAQDSPIHKDISEFNRQELSQISSGSDERLEAVRLAPSASNSQPWFFACQPEGIDVYRKKLGLLKGAMYETMNQIDVGIALCHLWLASEEHGKPFAFRLSANGPQREGYNFFGLVS